MEASFDDRRALETLDKLQPHQQLAAGAACCERMLPDYATFMAEACWGNLAQLRTALDAVWEACLRGASTEIDLERSLAHCEKSAPDAEDFSSLYVSSAQDAVFSVCALLDFLRDREPERIVSVLRSSTDSVDLIVQEQEEMDPRDPKREQRILEHPLMQQELIRQRRDLSEAGSLVSGDEDGLLAFRQRAATECNLILA
jgi:uncharacterized protein YjaG (DUF416 family)